MSAPRTDAVWKCAGCVHGFLVTTKYRPSSWAYVLTYAGEDKAEQVAERDHTACLCSCKAIRDGLSDPSDKRERVKIETRVVACEGFEMRPAPAEPTS